MRIVYLHQYFKTPSEGGAIRSYYLAKALVEKGHDVEVITTYNGKEDKQEVMDGIKVHYLAVYYDNSLGLIGRLSSFIKFAYKSYKKASSLKIDVCYATSTPLTIGLICLRLKKKFKIPYYFEVRDLWPEAPIQMGVINNPISQKALYKLEHDIYKNADKLIALSPGILDGILKSLGRKKPVYVIPNISDCDFFKQEVKSPELESIFNVKDKFVVSYFGAIGKVNHLEFMIDAMASAQEHLPNVYFLIAGKGSERSKIERLAKDKKLQNVSFLDYLTKDGVKELLNITDAAYISFAEKPILETSSPNKFFDAIAAGKLCIVNTKGWIKEMVEEKECGYYADPHHPYDFVAKLKQFVDDRDMLLRYQTNARKLAEASFSRTLQTESFCKLFSEEVILDSISD